MAFTIEKLIQIAKKCGDWNGQTVEMNDAGIEMFANLIAQEKEIELLGKPLYELRKALEESTEN